MWEETLFLWTRLAAVKSKHWQLHSTAKGWRGLRLRWFKEQRTTIPLPAGCSLSSVIINAISVKLHMGKQQELKVNTKTPVKWKIIFNQLWILVIISVTISTRLWLPPNSPSFSLRQMINKTSNLFRFSHSRSGRRHWRLHGFTEIFTFQTGFKHNPTKYFPFEGNRKGLGNHTPLNLQAPFYVVQSSQYISISMKIIVQFTTHFVV